MSRKDESKIREILIGIGLSTGAITAIIAFINKKKERETAKKAIKECLEEIEF